MTKTRFSRFFCNFTYHQKARFALVGIVNTIVDYCILFGLVAIVNTPILLANILSTSIALAVSYLLNKRAVFRNTDMHNTRQIFLFVTITLIGLWVIQGLIISAVSSLLWVTTNAGESTILFVSKLVATAATLLWNYTMYSRIVFYRSTSK